MNESNIPGSLFNKYLEQVVIFLKQLSALAKILEAKEEFISRLRSAVEFKSKQILLRDSEILALMEETLILKKEILDSKNTAYLFSTQIHNGLVKKNARAVQLSVRTFASKAAQSIAEDSANEMKAQVVEAKMNLATAKTALIEIKKYGRGISDSSIYPELLEFS